MFDRPHGKNKKIPKLITLIACVTAIIAILSSFYLNIPYRQALFRWSVNVIHTIQ